MCVLFGTLISYQEVRKSDHEMFVRMLTVNCDQNNRYEITINGFQVRNKTKYTMDPGIYFSMKTNK